MNNTTYKYKGRKGIDDLKCEYPFVATSQGDTAVSNDIAEYILFDGWLAYVFQDVPMTEKCIREEIQKRKEYNKKYIQELKDNNTFGEEYENTIEVKFNKLLDSSSDIVKHFENDLTSHKIIFLDTNEL